MMKALTWISGVLALLLMLCGTISFFRGGGFMGVNHAINFFHVANSMWLLTLVSLLIDTKRQKE